MSTNSPWIKAIAVKAVRHLRDFTIDIDEKAPRSLIITGPNGAGKTSLLDALWEYLRNIESDASLQHDRAARYVRNAQTRLEKQEISGDSLHEVEAARTDLEHWQDVYNRFYEKLEVAIENDASLSRLCRSKEFVIAYYRDFRNDRFVSPKNPEKPNLEYNVEKSKVGEFLKYLVDMKVQQALARNEGAEADASEIGKWFDDFEAILRRIFDDAELTLAFDYRTYVFEIETKGKRFPFSGLSAGYSAVMNIVADLMLKMRPSRPVCVFNLPGIVLVDEIETHLHLALQKEVLPILTKLFPNVQWIITSHSPFVINSVGNIIVYDIATRSRIEDSDEYSYDALAEGFFGVEVESGELNRRLDELAQLVAAGRPEDADRIESLFADFDKIPQVMAPRIKTRCSELKVRYYAARSCA